MQRYSYNTNFEVINKNKVKYITSLFINQIIKELKNGHLITVVVKIGLYEIDFK
jgi:nucleoid DNA-binding protein